MNSKQEKDIQAVPTNHQQKQRCHFDQIIKFQHSETFIHSKSIILAAMEYTFDIFYPILPYENRINIKDDGLSFYDKGFPEYCFDTIEDDINSWNFQNFLNSKKMMIFAEELVGIGPKVVLREILGLIDGIISQLKKQHSIKKIIDIFCQNEESLNNRYRFLRMVRECVAPVNLDYASYEIYRSMKRVWKSFIEIIVYTINQILQRSQFNKYYEPLLEYISRVELENKPRLEELIQQVKDTQSHYDDSNSISMIHFSNDQSDFKSEFIQEFEELPTQKKQNYYDSTECDIEEIASSDPQENQEFEMIEEKNQLHTSKSTMEQTQNVEKWTKSYSECELV